VLGCIINMLRVSFSYVSDYLGFHFVNGFILKLTSVAMLRIE